MTLTRASVYRRALPIILANASVPLLGLIDTAILGFFGQTQDLAALAIATVLFNMLFWAFGFLRMSTTGFIAQTLANDDEGRQTLFIRAVIVALVFSFLLLLFQIPIQIIAFKLLNASQLIESIASEYFYIRIWGAPATLTFYCVCGTLIAMGKSKWLLFFQVFLNLSNACLNYIMVVFWDMGLSGLAWGTIISEFAVVCLSLIIIHFKFISFSVKGSFFIKAKQILEYREMRRFIDTNRDIFIRTFFLLCGFFWFTNHSAKLGEVVLAANQILLILISFSAFFLDGFAFVAEAEVGKQYGAGNGQQFKRAVQLTTEAAGVTAVLMASTLWLFDHQIVAMLTNIAPVAEQVFELSHFAAIYILFSFAAFQLDGIFIAATAAREMRNASIVSFSSFIASYHLLTYIDPLKGLWLSFIAYVVFRSIALGWYYPRLLNNCYSNTAAEDLS